MSYTGVSPTFSLLKLDTYTLDGVATDFTLTYRVGAASAVDVYINGQFQEPNIAYSVSNKTLSLSETPPTGKMIVRYRSIEGMTPSGEVSVQGDSVVKRTNDGRVKISDATENDDAISKGQFDSEVDSLQQTINNTESNLTNTNNELASVKTLALAGL